LLALTGLEGVAQTTAPSAPSPAPTILHGILELDGPWRFHTGDDPRWSDPAFDDSSWQTVKLSHPLIDQGIDLYYGYAWYRIRIPAGLTPGAAAAGQSLVILPHTVGQLQVFVNGIEVAHTKGMSGRPALYQSLPFTVPLAGTSPDGSVVVTIRTWADAAITHGLIDRVELGDTESIADKLTLETARRWNRSALSAILAAFLFFCVAAIAATLYLAQRHHSEYLWLALLCLAVCFRGAIEITSGLGLIPITVFAILSPWSTWLFILTTLEFVHRFTGRRYPRIVRSMQIGALLLPLTSNAHLDGIYKYLSLASQFCYCGLVSFLLYRAWRRGRPEAGVMLLPFFFAATADSSDILLDFLANRGVLPLSFVSHRFHFGPVEYSTGTVTYLVFLASLIAVIFYRFIRVSQEEQKSTAEIEAARSVQALLIPTELPSSHNFVLEGAYLPANGVGGDFFQVLPLKDDSLLLVVGDVSGKGLRAAMNASTLVGALRNEMSHEPATVLNHLNQVLLGATSLASTNAVAGFATCLCARVYPDGRMIIANAGHLNPYRDGREVELAADLPLGIVSHIAYEQTTVQLKPGERLIFLSDGVVEATNAQGELFGFERTQQVSHESARYISQTAQRFGQNDDITVVSLYFVASTHRTDREPALA
jgi:hypothetical protein